MKILGLISSPSDPASRARIQQYIPYFDEKEHHLHCKYFRPLRENDPPRWAYRLKRITGMSEWRSSDLLKSAGRLPLLFMQGGYDIIWQNRLLQLRHSFWEKKLKKPVVFDMDDAIWMNEGAKQVEQKLEKAEMVFAGNDFLAEFAARFNRNVHVVPTTVDTRLLYPAKTRVEKFTLGWTGTKSNFAYLEMIKKPLLDFLADNPDAVLHIVSSESPAFLDTTHQQIRFEYWSPEKENELINQFSVGIMPLANDEWAKGKCGYKLLQYMACGKPVVASPVGVNTKLVQMAGTGILADKANEWYEAFSSLMKSHPAAPETTEKTRNFIVDNYSCSAWTDPITNLMKTLV